MVAWCVRVSNGGSGKARVGDEWGRPESEGRTQGDN